MSTTPIRTAERDANLFSINKDTYTLFAGTPDEHDIDLDEVALYYDPLHLEPEDPKAWDSILKVSGRQGYILRNVLVAQGKENSLDINNVASDLVFSGDWGVEGDEGEQVITIKGGSHGIILKGTIHSRGRRADIVLGLWSDQSTHPTHSVDLSGLKHITGRPLTIAFARAHRASIQLPPGAKVLKLKSLMYTIGWWAKRVWVKIRHGR